MKTTQHEYGYDGKFIPLNFIWITLNSLFLHHEPPAVGLLVYAGLYILFAAYNYVRHIPYKLYLIFALFAVGLAIAAWINPPVPFPGRTLFFIVLAGAIFYHLWLFSTVGKIFHNNEQRNQSTE